MDLKQTNGKTEKRINRYSKDENSKKKVSDSKNMAQRFQVLC